MTRETGLTIDGLHVGQTLYTAYATGWGDGPGAAAVETHTIKSIGKLVVTQRVGSTLTQRTPVAVAPKRFYATPTLALLATRGEVLAHLAREQKRLAAVEAELALVARGAEGLMRVLMPGTPVTTPFGTGIVVYSRMAPPDYDTVAVYSVSLDKKAGDPAYTGTIVAAAEAVAGTRFDERDRLD